MSERLVRGELFSRFSDVPVAKKLEVKGWCG